MLSQLQNARMIVGYLYQQCTFRLGAINLPRSSCLYEDRVGRQFPSSVKSFVPSHHCIPLMNYFLNPFADEVVAQPDCLLYFSHTEAMKLSNSAAEGSIAGMITSLIMHA